MSTRGKTPLAGPSSRDGLKAPSLGKKKVAQPTAASNAKQKKKDKQEPPTILLTPEATPEPEDRRTEVVAEPTETPQVVSSQGPAKEAEPAQESVKGPADQLAKGDAQKSAKGSDAVGGVALYPSLTDPSKGFVDVPFERAKFATGEEDESGDDDEQEDDGDSDGDVHMADLVEDERDPPSEKHQKYHKTATRYMNKIRENPDNQDAIQRLSLIDSRIESVNTTLGLPKTAWRLPVPTWRENVRLGQAALRKASNGSRTKEETKAYLQQLDTWSKDFLAKGGFPEEWAFEFSKQVTGPEENQPAETGEDQPTEPGENQPAEPGENQPAEPGENQPAEPADDAQTPEHAKSDRVEGGWGVITKVSIKRLDLPEGITEFGKICMIQKVGRGTRIFVNDGTEKHPHFETYPGSTIGRGIAEGLLQSGKYPYRPLPTDLKFGEVTFRGRVTVKRSPRADGDEAPKLAQKQFYIVDHAGTGFIVSRSAVKAMREGGTAVLQKTDNALDMDMENQKADFRKHFLAGRHPDTGEVLTAADLGVTPWLCSKAVRDSFREVA